MKQDSTVWQVVKLARTRFLAADLRICYCILAGRRSAFDFLCAGVVLRAARIYFSNADAKA